MKKKYTKPKVAIERFETSVMANANACTESIYLAETPCGNVDDLGFDDDYMGYHQDITICVCLNSAEIGNYFYS